MSWANFFTKAKENHERSWTIVAHGRTFVIGAIFVGAAVYGLYSDVRLQIHGRPATATLLGHIQKCTVEYQRVGEPERKEQWPCELAEETQRRVGSNKLKISRDSFARLRFPLEDGRTHEAMVNDVKLGSYKLAIGATLPINYAPENPADIRAKVSWDRLKIQLIMLAIGMPCLILAFGGSFSSLFGWAFRGRGDETATSDYLAPAATQMHERGDSNRVPRNPVAQTAVSSFSRPSSSAPRASFGTRNRVS